MRERITSYVSFILSKALKIEVLFNMSLVVSLIFMWLKVISLDEKMSQIRYSTNFNQSSINYQIENSIFDLEDRIATLENRIEDNQNRIEDIQINLTNQKGELTWLIIRNNLKE
jgi:hypothetical protein